MRNDNVEMRAEDLLISAKEISVRYRFFNTSDKNVTVLVAFPLPEISIDEPDQNIAVPTEDPVNFLAFTTTVNGQPVKTEIEQRQVVGDRTGGGLRLGRRCDRIEAPPGIMYPFG